MTTETTKGKSPSHIIYQVIDREGDKALWSRIGAAWTNADGSLFCRLNAFPMTGKTIIREFSEKEEA